jgi:signal transduction histidine kinase
MTTVLVSSADDASAASSESIARRLLDRAVMRAITALAHDIRNALGIVSMQVEAIAMRASGATPDLAKITGHADAAADQMEQVAHMVSALLSFARGRRTSDLTVLVTEAAALVPLRPITLEMPETAAVGIDPVLARAVVIEALLIGLESKQPLEMSVVHSPAGSTLHVTMDPALTPNSALEWVVQFREAGGHLAPIDAGLRLAFPPLA